MAFYERPTPGPLNISQHESENKKGPDGRFIGALLLGPDLPLRAPVALDVHYEGSQGLRVVGIQALGLQTPSQWVAVLRVHRRPSATSTPSRCSACVTCEYTLRVTSELLCPIRRLTSSSRTPAASCAVA